MPNNWSFQIVLEKILESPLGCKEIKRVHPKGNQSWMFIGRTDAEAEAPILWPPDAKTHWKRPWCWERLRAGGEVGGRGWDGWMASLTQWTRVWANSGRKWRTRTPGVLQTMGSQRVGHNLATEQQWRDRGRHYNHKGNSLRKGEGVCLPEISTRSSFFLIFPFTLAMFWFLTGGPV